MKYNYTFVKWVTVLFLNFKHNYKKYEKRTYLMRIIFCIDLICAK